MSTSKSSTALRALSFEGQPLQTFTDAKGMTWWVARDVCRILDLDNVGQALARLRSREKDDIINSDGMGRSQHMIAINEPGLYRLIMLSRKKEAEAFQDWVFEDVLPAIRTTGGYIAVPAQASGLALSWEDYRQITPTQVRIFAWAWERPARWFTTRDLRQHAQIHEVTAREYARYFSHMGLWEKRHHHPANLYRVEPQAVHRPSALLGHLLTARDLPLAAFPLLPTPDWQ